MRKVLDAWALLAWLQDERPAAEKVQAMLEAAEAGTLQLAISMINAGEIYYGLVRKRGPEEARAFLSDLKSMGIRTLAVPKKLVIEAAEFKGRYPISYADAFAIATTIREKAPLVTGDPELKVFKDRGIVEVEWVGK